MQVLYGLFYVLLQLLVVAPIILSSNLSFIASFIAVVIPPLVTGDNARPVVPLHVLSERPAQVVSCVVRFHRRILSYAKIENSVQSSVVCLRRDRFCLVLCLLSLVCY